MPPLRSRLPAGGLANWALNAALAAALAAAWMHVRSLPPPAVPHPAFWWELLPAFYLAELAVVHLSFRKDAFTFSLPEMPLVAGLLIGVPAGVLGAQFAAVAVVSIWPRRQPAVKVCFNTLKYSLEAGVALSVFSALRPSDPLGLAGSLVACLAVAGSTIAGGLVTGLAIWLSEGQRPPRLRAAMEFSALAALTNASVALVAVILVQTRPFAAVLLVAPAAVAVLGYRSYLWQLRERDRIARLYDAGQALQAAVGTEASIAAVLRHAKLMFRATMAELQLEVGADEILRASLGLTSDGVSFARGIRSDPDVLLDQAGRPAQLVNTGFGRGELERRLRRRGLRSAMLAPLGREGSRGILLVGNPERPAQRFEESALGFVETFATQAGVSFEKDRLQEQFRHLAFHDPLTSLANRALFADRINLALRRARRLGTTPAVLLLDLDDFKVVNDSLGHSAGDQLLVAVADRLRACIRPHDTGARLGGDEFAILLEDAHAAREAESVADRISAAMADPFRVEGQEITVGSSIGIAVADLNTAAADDLLRSADLAMYQAKSHGKARWVLYEPSMRDAVIERLLLKGDLEREAMPRQLVVEYQPIVNVDSGLVVGAEALVRWNHPVRGLLPPAAFVRLAEETGLVVALGRHVLEQACREAQAWGDLGRADLVLAVNVSARQLQEETFPEEVLDILERTGLAPTRLVVEITESSVMDSPDLTAARCARLREAGVRIALDDFGTGFSSLNLLDSLGFDVIKISKEFTDRLVGLEGRQEFSAAILRLGSTLGMVTIAEGVERAEQAAALRELGCDLAQGYHYHRPLAREAMRELVIAAPAGDSLPRPRRAAAGG